MERQVQDEASYWERRWRDAVLHFSHGIAVDKNAVDYWQSRAESFDRVRRVSPPNRTLLAAILKTIDSNTTVIDIGAGTGAFTIPLARAAYRVTAVDPSAAMLDVLKRNLKQEGISNVQLVQARWEDVEISNHDVSLCSHSMYSSPDLRAFIDKIRTKTLRRAFMLIRVKSRDGVLGELWQKYRGEAKPEEPTLILAYNLLYHMGVYADVELEPETHSRTDANIDEAASFVRSFLDLEMRPGLMDELRQYLEGVLTYSLEGYRWPEKAQSALVSWTPPGRAYHKD